MSFVLLGSSVTSTTHGKEYHYNVITCLCWCGLIHKFSVKICCGLCWMLMNVFRANEQATTLPKFASLLIVAVFPALYKNCFLLFHLPVPLYYSKDFMLRLHVLPCTWFKLKLPLSTKQYGNPHRDSKHPGWEKEPSQERVLSATALGWAPREGCSALLLPSLRSSGGSWACTDHHCWPNFLQFMCCKTSGCYRI